jgi:hypothetical protein
MQLTRKKIAFGKSFKEISSPKINMKLPSLKRKSSIDEIEIKED